MNQHHNKTLLLGLALWLILTGTYIFSYSGLPLSSDEYIIFDSTQSLVLNGTMARTIGFNVDPSIQEDGTPWPQQKYEPLQVILAVPFFWIGHHLADIGRLHTVFTLNIFIMALTALSLYTIALRRGYSLAVAWWGALIFGVATAAWPYSRWIFREPVMGLFVLWSFHFATQIPNITQRKSVWRQALLTVLTIVAAILTKQIGWLILPAIALSLFSTRDIWRHALPAVVIPALIFGSLILVVMFLQPDVEEGRYSFTRWTDFDTLTWKSVPESLLGYHVSPARSLWLFSPILTAGWVGAVMLWRKGQWRVVVGPALALILVSASYGITRQSTVWNGGWGWGPRYMVPFVPVLMLWVLPILEWLFRKPSALKHYAGWFAFIPLLIASIGMQWLGLGVPYTNYYTELQFTLFDDPARFDEWQEWADYNWVWSESQIPYHWRHFSGDQLQPAWTMVDPAWVVPLLTLMMVLIGTGLSGWVIFAKKDLSQLHRSLKISLTSMMLLSPLIPISEGIHQLREDKRYINEQGDMFHLINILNDEVQPDDIVFIERGEYSRLFMNYFKADAVLMTLPLPLRGGYQEGEPEIPDEELYPAIGVYGGYVLDWAADRFDRLWLVTSSGPFITNAIRPSEKILTIRYFPIREYTVSQTARAILYDTVDAPGAPSAYQTDVVFGDLLGLWGFDLPRGTTYHPGDVVAVSVVLAALQPTVTDYNVSVRISDANHRPIIQQDGLPMATFGHTSRWEIGRTYRDNHGLKLPADLPPGEYYVEVTVYNYVTGENLAVRVNDDLPPNRIATLIPITVVEKSDD